MSAYSFSAHGLAMRKVPQGVLDTVNQLLFDASQVGGNLPFTDFSKIWQDSAGTTPYTAVEQPVGKIIDKSPNALAFTQATSAARPVDSARVNGFTATEDISQAAWLKRQATVSGVDKIQEDSSTNLHYVRQDVPVLAGVYTLSFEAKQSERTIAWASLDGSSNTLWFDLANGVSGGVGVGSSKITSIGDGWYKCEYIMTKTAGTAPCLVGCSNSTTITSYPGVTGNGIFLRKLAIAKQGTAYQRVNTATDYDTVGFPEYTKFDGIDDNWVSAAGGGGTAGIYFCGAIRFNIVGAVQTIFSDAGTNSGYKLQLTAANQLQISAGNGTAFTAVNTTGTFAAGDVSLVELWDDGTNLGVRLGEGTPVTVARPVVTAGTAQITLGKDNNAASNYAGISMFEPIWRYGAMPNATQREAIRAICRSKAGIV